jgi:hypothetical protein
VGKIRFTFILSKAIKYLKDNVEEQKEKNTGAQLYQFLFLYLFMLMQVVFPTSCPTIASKCSDALQN